jgi:hypothetical protein
VFEISFSLQPIRLNVSPVFSPSDYHDCKKPAFIFNIRRDFIPAVIVHMAFTAGIFKLDFQRAVLSGTAVSTCAL